MLGRKVCGQCGAEGPAARSTETLAGSGWRLDIRRDATGESAVSWLCPACWEKKTGAAPLTKASGRKPA